MAVDATAEVTRAAPRVHSERRWSTVLLVAPSVALLVGFVVLPFIYVIRVSFATQGLFGSIGSGWTLANYRQFFQTTYLQILGHSIWLSFENTAICLVVGYIVGYFLAFRAGRATPVFVLLLIVPFWASSSVRMSAWMILLSPHGIVASVLHTLHLAFEFGPAGPEQRRRPDRAALRLPALCGPADLHRATRRSIRAAVRGGKRTSAADRSARTGA